MADGLKYFALAVIIALSGFGMASFLAIQLELEPGSSAGLLAGGLTSSTTLAAAQEALHGGTITLPDGWSVDTAVGNMTASYAITYLFGLVGLGAMIKLLPGALGIDLAQEAKQLAALDSDYVQPLSSNITARTYRVANEAFTRMSIADLHDQYGDRFQIAKVRRDGEFIHLGPEELLQLGDEVIMLGHIEFFTSGIQAIGEEIQDPDNVLGHTDTVDMVVTKREVLGKTLGELQFALEFGVILLHIRRMRIELSRTKSLKLRKGDLLTVVGPAANIDFLGQEIGYVERAVAETDMVTFAAGIAAGVLLGLVSVQIGGVSVGLGSAGGLLTSGLIIGFLRSIRPTFGRLPDAARWIFMEFGLLIFMAGVGMQAGENILATFVTAGPKLVLAGILVTTTPVLCGYLFGAKVLKLNPVLLFGAITGAMTSGASLSVLTKEANSSVPILGYTGSYAFANILLTIAGSLILLV